MSDATQAELARQIQTNEELRRLIEQMRKVLDPARAFRRAYLHAEHAAELEDSGERLARSVASWYAEADRTQAALFAALEAIDGPLVYEEMIAK